MDKEEVKIVIEAIIKISESLEKIKEDHIEIKDLIKVIRGE